MVGGRDGLRGGVRRRAAVVVIAVLGLVAGGCADGGGLARIPLGASGGTRETSADAAALSMAAPLTFTLADGVDLPGSDAEAWRWEAPDVDAVTALAGRLGLAGPATEVPADLGGGWTVEDPANVASLSVAAGGSWSASGGDPTAVATPDCAGRAVAGSEPAAAYGGSGAAMQDDAAVCEDVASGPPPDLPADDEVVAAATAIFGDGVAARVDWRDTWSVAVVVDYLLDGVSSGQTGYYAAYGTGWFASGILGGPVREGAYPTISALNAVARLTGSPLGLGPVAAGGSAVISGPVVADAVPPATDPVEPPPVEPPLVDPMPVPIDPLVTEPMPIEPVPIESMPIEPVPEPEPVEIVLVAVAATLVSFIDGTGAVWSLPGYRYTDADGGTWEVVAVSDEYFDAPVEVPGGAGGDLPVDGDEPVTGGVPSFPGGGDPGVSDPDPGALLPDVVGLGEIEATAALEQAGFVVRVVERDGEAFMVTKDYRVDRANLVVADGVVTAVTVG